MANRVGFRAAARPSAALAAGRTSLSGALDKGSFEIQSKKIGQAKELEKEGRRLLSALSQGRTLGSLLAAGALTFATGGLAAPWMMAAATGVGSLGGSLAAKGLSKSDERISNLDLVGRSGENFLADVRGKTISNALQDAMAAYAFSSDDILAGYKKVVSKFGRKQLLKQSKPVLPSIT